MVWTKNRPVAPGELEFHLTGLRRMQGEAAGEKHDESWYARRVEKLDKRHHRPT